MVGQRAPDAVYIGAQIDGFYDSVCRTGYGMISSIGNWLVANISEMPKYATKWLRI